MSSMMTNAAAMTALQTLTKTNKYLEETQTRISTGYRVADAKDNAAYWSISTTMRSDNQAMSAVKDSLGIGAATVDTAYTGLTSAKDVLNEIKAKLTASTQDGVDRTKIQDEIRELQEQLKSIAASASFSGQNWLSVISDLPGYDPNRSMIANFARDQDGAVSLGTINVDTGALALYSRNYEGDKGILDSHDHVRDADGNVLPFGGYVYTGYGLSASGVAGTQHSVVTGYNAYSASYYAGTFNSALTGMDTGDAIQFNFTVDMGVSVPVSVSLASVTDAASFSSALQSAIDSSVGSGRVSVNVSTGGPIYLHSATIGATSRIVVGPVAGFNADGDTSTTSTLGFTGGSSFGADAVAARTTTGSLFSGPSTLDDDDSISFDIAINGGLPQTVVIRQSTVDAALSGDSGYDLGSGKIRNASAFARVMNQALAEAGVPGYTVTNNGGAMTFTADTPGAGSVSVTNGRFDGGPPNSISIDRIDLTKLDAVGATSEADKSVVIKGYLKLVDNALSKVTAGASTLGAIQNRLDMQTTFVSNLMHTIDQGIGTLVDADMTEESTRLKALQTQQQLGVQALSIANSTSQALLQLFK